ncbi:MAG: hypothetical protein EOM87_10445 [Clostridia bacterium]|nr:hypothetical protein [Clostridia bacterium]
MQCGGSMSWVLGIVGVILLSVLVDIILPNGQMNKYIKGIFAILFIYMLLTPIVSLVKNNLDINNLLHFEVSGYEENTAYIQSINTDRLNYTKDLIVKVLEVNGINDANIVIFSAANNINLVDYVVVELPYATSQAQEEQIKTIIMRLVDVKSEGIRVLGYP